MPPVEFLDYLFRTPSQPMPKARPYSLKKLLRAPATSRSIDTSQCRQLYVFFVPRSFFHDPQFEQVPEVPGSVDMMTCRPV